MRRWAEVALIDCATSAQRRIDPMLAPV